MSARRLAFGAWVGVVGGLLGLSLGPAAAQNGGDFHRGKTIRVIIDYAPGDGYDVNARLAARHLGKYLPGKELGGGGRGHWCADPDGGVDGCA